MLTAIIPDPDGPDFRKEIHGDSVDELARNARTFIHDSCYGASAIGSKFATYRDGNIVGTLSYNGRFHWADPLYARDEDCPKCGWGLVGCREEETGCTRVAQGGLHVLGS